MKKEIAWLTDALATKNIAREMTHYLIKDNQIRATDGRITAGHPFPYTDDAFLVPGQEFEKLLKRLPSDPTLERKDDAITLKVGRSRGTIQCLDPELWSYPGIDENQWEDIPDDLVSVLRDLIPFVSTNATHQWSLGIALDHGYAYATNNVVLAGCRCDMGNIDAIVPIWAAEFVVDRPEGLVQWCWTDNYVAFRWDNGAWMRSALIEGTFHERAAEMIRNAEQLPVHQEIDEGFKEVFNRAVALSSDVLTISKDTISGSFGAAQYEDGVELDLEDEKTTYWNPKFLEPVMKVATHWNPSDWPNPALFKGDRIFGYVLGRQP